MDLSAALQKVLDEYPTNEPFPEFEKNPLAIFIRREIPKLVAKLIPDPELYKIKGSPGAGGWAQIPWVAVLDPLVTTTATKGYYPVFLFSEDLSGVFLSLGQGTTEIRQGFKADTHKVLRANANRHLLRVGAAPKGFTTGPTILNISPQSRRGPDYQQANVFAKYYPSGAIPSDEEIQQDLTLVLESYSTIAQVDDTETGAMETQDNSTANEDGTKIRFHKRIERNSALSKKAKKIHGLTCQACKFDFKETYGTLGEGFIEAHHLIPISSLNGRKVAMNPKTDFAVLCSNCHRMAHRLEDPSDISKLINAISQNIPIQT